MDRGIDALRGVGFETDESPLLPEKPIRPGAGGWNGSHARSHIYTSPLTTFTGFIRSRPQCAK